MNPVRATLSILVVILSVGTTVAQSDQSFPLKKQTRLPSVKHIDAGYYQERVREFNKDSEGVILISKEDRKIQFALIDNNGTMLWRKDAPSTWVVLSEHGSNIAFIGQKSDDVEGYALGEWISYAGVDVLNSKGNAVFSVPKAGLITQLSFSPNDDLFINDARGILSVYDRAGNRLWFVKQKFAEVSFSGEGKYLKTFAWNNKDDIFTLSLLESQTGKTVRSITYKRKKKKRILCVDPKNETLLMAEFNLGKKPIECALALYDLKTWSKTKTLDNLPAGPFSVAHNRHANGYCLLTLEPDGLIMTYWDLDDGSVTRKQLGRMKVDFGTDRITFNAEDNTYDVQIGSRLFTYDHSR